MSRRVDGLSVLGWDHQPFCPWRRICAQAQTTHVDTSHIEPAKGTVELVEVDDSFPPIRLRFPRSFMGECGPLLKGLRLEERALMAEKSIHNPDTLRVSRLLNQAIVVKTEDRSAELVPCSKSTHKSPVNIQRRRDRMEMRRNPLRNEAPMWLLDGRTIVERIKCILDPIGSTIELCLNLVAFVRRKPWPNAIPESAG